MATNEPSLKGVDLSGQDLLKVFDDLHTLPSPLPKGWRQRRGHGFERILHESLVRSCGKARPPYTSTGEQIDGAFLLDHRWYVYEAKWEKSPMGSTRTGAFRQKIQNKLSGTIGFYFSVSGYKQHVAGWLAKHSELNLLLVDYEDIRRGFKSGMDDILRLKLEAAATEGVNYLRIDQAEEAANSRATVIVTEGPRDASVIGMLIDRIGEIFGFNLNAAAVPAYGVFQIAAQARYYQGIEGIDHIVMLADGEGLGTDVIRHNFADELQRGIDLIVAQPRVESWFTTAEIEALPVSKRRESLGLVDQKIRTLSKEDLAQLRRSHAELDELINILEASRD